MFVLLTGFSDVTVTTMVAVRLNVAVFPFAVLAVTCTNPAALGDRTTVAEARPFEPVAVPEGVITAEPVGVTLQVIGVDGSGLGGVLASTTCTTSGNGIAWPELALWKFPLTICTAFAVDGVTISA